MDTVSKCDKCGHDNHRVQRMGRRSMITCDGCGDTLCIECLAAMLRNKSQDSASAVDAQTAEAMIATATQAAELMQQDEDLQEILCPDCFEHEDATQEKAST